MEYTAPAEYEIHLLTDGALTVTATWISNTYYIECYGLGDDAESAERDELRLIGAQSVAFNFSGTHAAGGFSTDAFDALDVEDFRLAITGDGAYTTTSLTGHIFLDYTANLSADPEGDTCASMTVTYDFQILTASPLPASE
jgi:hypothetical protein